MSSGDLAASEPDQHPLAAALSETFHDQIRNQRLPLTPEQVSEIDGETLGVPTDKISTHTRFFKLNNDAAWTRLTAAFESGKTANLRPWYRCIGILREHGAETAIAETYYVCLDHKSEIASFYSHLDRARRTHTVRLHFFKSDIPERALMNLERDYNEDYLGYIVCRSGELPLVGRALLRPPEYVKVSTAIREDVNLLGQKLTVHGVPFMQQDSRFAVCAHVAMWTLQYTAYRRGINERRLIGQIVRENRPLQPRGSQGLSEQQVIDGLANIGFRAESMLTPDARNQSLPDITLNELAPLLSSQALQFAEANATAPQLQHVGNLVVAQLAREAETQSDPVNLEELGLTEEQWTEQDEARARNVHEIQRALLDYFLRDWIDSGLPVYAALSEHALVVCGRTLDQRPTYFVHDDNYGPYLKLADLCHVPLQELLDQSGRFTDASAGTASASPPADRVMAALDATDPNGDGTWEPTARVPANSNPVQILFTATPHRLMLAPSAARRRAAQIIAPLSQIDDSYEEEGNARVVVTMLMGIDYKRQRRMRAGDGSATTALTAYSSVQLAEWVSVVEGLDDDENSLWELVFDASSSNDAPLLQLARVRNTLMVADPLDGRIEEASLRKFRCGRVLAPVRIGKASGHEAFVEGGTDGVSG